MQTFRTVATPAIVIRRERMGESHKGLVLLDGRTSGLVRATAYGAWKMHSSLRLGSEPFVHSLARLYHDPVKNTCKVTDLEVRESFDGLRADLARIEAASLWAEVVQKSLAAGETAGGLFRPPARLPARPGIGRRGPGAPTRPRSFSGDSSTWRATGPTPAPASAAAGRSARPRAPPGSAPRAALACARVRGRHRASRSAPGHGATSRRPVTWTSAAALAVSLDAASLAGLGARARLRDPRGARDRPRLAARGAAALMRVFAALPLPPEAIDALAPVQAALREPAVGACGPRAPPGMHLTLHFFGEVDDGRRAAPRSGSGASPIVRGPRLAVSFGPLGTFPPRGEPACRLGRHRRRGAEAVVRVPGRTGRAPRETLGFRGDPAGVLAARDARPGGFDGPADRAARRPRGAPP